MYAIVIRVNGKERYLRKDRKTEELSWTSFFPAAFFFDKTQRADNEIVDIMARPRHATRTISAPNKLLLEGLGMSLNKEETVFGEIGLLHSNAGAIINKLPIERTVRRLARTVRTA